MTYLTKEAAQQVLAVLEDACGDRCNAEYNPCWQRQAADRLQAAIDAPEQEPVAVVERSENIDGFRFREIDGRMKWLRHGDKLYTAPPAPQAPCQSKSAESDEQTSLSTKEDRQARELSDAEILEAIEKIGAYEGSYELAIARAVLAERSAP